MPQPDEFEPIPWEVWTEHYWIPTVSAFLPRVFVLACRHDHTADHPHIQDYEGIGLLDTTYFPGEDGLTYEMRRDKATGVAEPHLIYKTKRDL